jgi:hypothetical protein
MSNPEIETQTQTYEINPEPLGEDKLKEIVMEILQNPNKCQVESRLILTIKREGRRRGCGYVYLYKKDYKVVVGDVYEVTIKSGEYNCDWFEDVAIIPLTVPVVILEDYHDDDPQVRDYAIVHVFGSEGWRSVKVQIPK